MLFVNGYLLCLVAIVIVLAIASVIALLTRASSLAEATRPVILSDEDRLLLQAMAFETRKQGRQEGKKKQQRLARKGRAEGNPTGIVPERVEGS